MCEQCSMNSNIHKLHDWMYTLLYPSVLGTMIFAFLSGWTEEKVVDDYKLCFAIFLIVYFSSQHVQNVLDKSEYTGPEFLSDFLEVLFMPPLFYLLGFYKCIPILCKCDFNEWTVFYPCLSVVFALPIIARAASGKFKCSLKYREGWLSLLSTIVALVSLAGLCANESYWILGILSTVVVFYLYGFVFEKTKGRLYGA